MFKWSYRILRALIVTALILGVVIPCLLFVGLSLPSVQDAIRRRAESELSELLDADVSIKSLGIMPFNRVVVRGVSVVEKGDTVAVADHIGAGIDLYALLAHRDIVVRYAVIIGLDARLSRATPDAPLNIQPIIDALQPKDRNKPPTQFELAVNTVVLRRCAFGYDVLSEPETPGRFNTSHIRVTGLRGDLSLRRISNDGGAGDIRRLSFSEQSGLTLSDMHVGFDVTPQRLSVSGLGIEMPQSAITFNDIELRYDGWKNLTTALATGDHRLVTGEESHVAFADIASLVPSLGTIDAVAQLNIDISGNLDDIRLNILGITVDELAMSLTASGHLTGIRDRNKCVAELTEFELYGNGPVLVRALDGLGVTSAAALSPRLRALGDFTVTGDAQISRASGYADLAVTTARGDIAIDANYAARGRGVEFAGQLSTEGIDVGALAGRDDIGDIAADIVVTGSAADRRLHTLEVDATVPLAVYRGHSYRDIETTVSLKGRSMRGHLALTDEYCVADLVAAADLTRGSNAVSLHGILHDFAPHALGLTRGMAGMTFSTDIDIALAGSDLWSLDGDASLYNISLRRADGRTLDIDAVNIDTHNSTLPRHTTLRSDLLILDIDGAYQPRTMVRDIRDIIAGVFPVITGYSPQTVLQLTPDDANVFSYTLTVKGTEPYVDFLRLPVSIIYPVTVAGKVDRTAGLMTLDLDAPYLRQGNKLIEGTRLTASVGGPARTASLDFTTTIPTKNGAMPLSVTCDGADDVLNTGIKWHIDRRAAYNGDISLSTRFRRDDTGRPAFDVLLNNSQMAFNDTVWHIRPARIGIHDRVIDVDGINIGYGDRYVRIDGRASAATEDTLTLRLNDINLDYIFQSLQLDNVQLGGDATGTFYATQLLSGEPHIDTPGLRVRDISYNGTVFGDATVRSGWDRETRGITLDADVAGADSCSAHIYGAIYPLNESLDITFDATHIPVGFMQYYMSAFTGDITGRASGRARLFGTFKYIDMEGDIKAENLRMRVDFTNTYYTTSDSVTLRPGLIRINGATLTDDYGNTARMNGWVRHKFFKEPSFDFSITDARNLLCYNETERENPDWYGKVFGSGTAYVRGIPGTVDIGVHMRTRPGSTFTFVLSDSEEAGEYSFLTFRDRAALERPDTVAADNTPALVRRLRSQVNSHAASIPTIVNIDIEADITPDAAIILIMDPVGGDRIRAVGKGSLRLLYATNDDMKMYGSYTLDRGSYNFTLQDIIIKDFTIRDGSTITFRGDPYNAELDIRAVYSLNANLSDLDESFLQDKELNRTNVPVNAMLLVNGSIQSPDIHFDLEFPTLTSDTYRKVRSIISTDDMMNRQIIYLLALNRFYTPDYMASTTKGNELVSVASSTISSQLSSILGQLSDNWMIAPQFRSDRGDFSDVEVDLALSSTLLNNRLMFNGNFGYRDKSLNNTQFIGDFDLEYLLNRSGTIRLKAYNRFNDSNYYIRTSTTTQGVGIVFKRDFDRMFNFLRPHRRRDTIPAPAAAPATVTADSITITSETLR